MATEIDIRTEEPRQGRRLFFRALLALLFLALGAALTHTAYPRFMSGLIVAEHELTLLKMRRGQATTMQARAAAIEDYRRAVGWVEDASLQKELGALAFSLGQDRGLPTSLRRSYFIEAEKALVSALARSPGDPYAWTQLAYARLLLHGPNDSFNRTLTQAITSGPYQPTLILPRLRLGLSNWPSLLPDTKQAVENQIWAAANLFPHRLRSALQNDLQRRLVSEVLASRPDLIKAVME